MQKNFKDKDKSDLEAVRRSRDHFESEYTKAKSVIDSLQTKNKEY